MPELSITDLSDDIRKAISELKTRPEIESVGIVTRVGDGIAWIYGLSKAGYSEMLEIEGVSGKNVTAFAFNLGEDEIGAVLLGEDTEVEAGAKVRLERPGAGSAGRSGAGRPRGGSAGQSRWTAASLSKPSRPPAWSAALRACWTARACTNR